jgi:uncharacterized protein (TIGR03437 family)
MLRVGCIGLAAMAVSVCASANNQLSLSAYRALGQVNLQQNGVNMVEAGTLNSPEGIAVDASGHLYVADTANHRVLGWENAASFQNGAPASIALGQPNLQQSIPDGIGSKGLVYPSSVAINPLTGDLFVADTGNNRVVRFASPFANLSNVTPDAFYGQPNSASRVVNAGGLSGQSMSGPTGVACDSQGNLWVADTGNNRVLRFPASVLNATNPAADIVLGQANATTGTANRGSATISGSGFSSPHGLAFDAKNNLYVADYLNTRVLLFPAPMTAASTASVVYGQSLFTTRGVPKTPTASSLAGPVGLALNASGELYVAVPADSRVLVFPAGAASGAAATSVIGQPNLTSNTPDAGSFPEASATSLAGVTAVAVDSKSNVLAADTVNNRVLFFPANASAATGVLGQTNFAGNAPNQIKAASINAPYKMAIDYSQSPFALYVSDTNNNRVLIWTDSAHFHNGDPANLVIGQPNLTSAVANVDSGGTATPSATGLYGPRGIAIGPSGDLYVADAGNNRVLHYPRPVAQSGRITPDIVLGQPDFVTGALAEVSAGSLNSPGGLALGPNGDLFIADSGNNRVLEFASGPKTGATALRVYGQSSFTTSTAPSTASADTLTAPQGLTLDATYNLYVADTAANRVVIYPSTNTAPATGLAASVVLGQGGFTSTTAGRGATGLHFPFDVGLDSGGDIFVSDEANNRVVAYPSLVNLLLSPTTPYSAYEAVGQQNLTTVGANWDTTNGSATPEGLAAPAGIFVDRRDTLYVGDTGNNRVVQFLKAVSIENAATLQAGAPVGQGSWCTLLGTGLSTSTQQVTSGAQPTSLADRQLVVNGQLLAPLSYVSPQQINFVLPWETPLGTQAIATRLADTGEPLAGGTLSVAAYAPGLFTSDGKGLAGSGQAKAFNQDNTVNSSSNPAALGSVVHVLGTGQGPVVTPVADGQPAPASQDKTVATPTSDGVTCLSSQSHVCVALGGSGGGAAFANIQYSGLAPGMVGVWQLSFTIPSTGLLGNSMGVRAAIGGANISNLVTVYIK